MSSLFSDGVLATTKPIHVVDSSKVNLTNIDRQLAECGTAEMQAVTQLSTKMLSSVKASDTDQFGIKLNELVAVSKKMDPASIGKKTIVKQITALFSNAKQQMLAQFNTVEDQIQQIVAELDKSSDLHRSRIADFEEMFSDNYKLHQGLQSALSTQHTLKLGLESALNEATTVITTDSFQAQQIRDIQTAIDRVDHKISEVEKRALICKFMAPQIRQLQDNARSLVATFDNVKTTAIPAWRNAFTMYIAGLEQKKSAELAQGAYDATEAALRMSADQFKDNTLAIAKGKNRSFASIETLTHMQTQLITTFDELGKIEQQDRKDRANARDQLKQLEAGLIQKFSNKNTQLTTNRGSN